MRLREVRSILDDYWPPAAFLCSWMSWTSLRLVSRKRSTQLERQDSSEREKRVDGVPATHLVFWSITGERKAETAMDVLVPTHASHFVD